MFVSSKLRRFPAELFVFLVAAIALFVIQSTFLGTAGVQRREPPLLPPPELPHFAFGFRESAADFLWIRSIQGFPPCQESDKAMCPDRKWLGAMFLAITDLAPHFRMVYAVGGMTLSVLQDDQESASILYDRGTKEFPEDWRILSRAAYHAMSEEKKSAKAADLLKRAAHLGAPPWYLMLATRLRAENGDREFGEQIIRELEADPEKNADLIRSLREKLAHSGGSAATR